MDLCAPCGFNYVVLCILCAPVNRSYAKCRGATAVMEGGLGVATHWERTLSWFG